jgi:hypothetical protein
VVLSGESPRRLGCEEVFRIAYCAYAPRVSWVEGGDEP